MLRVEMPGNQMDARSFRAPPRNVSIRVTCDPPQGPVDTDGTPDYPSPGFPYPYPPGNRK